MKQKTRERHLLREAGATLALARLAVRFVPSERIFGWAGRRPSPLNRFAVNEIERVAWAVDTVSARGWIKASDLPRALAAQAMLSRRGVVSSVCLGVARAGGDLTSHAWLERDGKVILGEAGTGVVRVARFGAESG